MKNKHRYRFKTLDEFEKEFERDDSSYYAGSASFVGKMFHLAGVPIPDEFSEKIMENPDGVRLNLENIVEGKDNNWYFTPEMLTLNEHGEDAQRSKENLEKLNKLVIEGAKHTLESNGYFVFPKAPEGDFPDLSDFDGVEMEVCKDNKTDIVKDTILCKCSFYPYRLIGKKRNYQLIQPELTPEEIVEKLGRENLLEQIKKIKI